MRAYVFTDASLARYAGRFVWLSIDIDNPANAKFVAKYQTPGVPAFFVIDPAKEVVTTRYVGGFTLASLKKFLNDVGGAPKNTAGDEALLRADRLATEGKHAEAATAYDEALKALPKKSLKYARAAEGYVFSLQMTNDHERCVSRGLELAHELKGTTSGSGIAAGALDCATEIDEAKRDKAVYAELEGIVGSAVRNKALDLSGDDRSGYYITLIGARSTVKDEEGAQKLREEWSSFLDAEAAKAKTPEERTVYDSHRLSAYLELKQPEKAIPMLQLSEREFPTDYNPPSRLAAAYRAMKLWDEAIASSKKAVALSQGPRRVLIYRGLADAYLGKGDKDAARATLKEAMAYTQSLPDPDRMKNTLASLQKKMDSIQ
jgi:tetratricopeptide (TPR) repeat protein